MLFRFYVTENENSYTYCSIDYPTLNTWTQICGTQNGENISLFENGNLKCSKVLTHKISEPSIGSTVLFGKSLDKDDYFKGKLDDITFFDAAFTDVSNILPEKIGNTSR